MYYVVLDYIFRVFFNTTEVSIWRSTQCCSDVGALVSLDHLESGPRPGLGRKIFRCRLLVPSVPAFVPWVVGQLPLRSSFFLFFIFCIALRSPPRILGGRWSQRFMLVSCRFVDLFCSRLVVRRLSLLLFFHGALCSARLSSAFSCFSRLAFSRRRAFLFLLTLLLWKTTVLCLGNALLPTDR